MDHLVFRICYLLHMKVFYVRTSLSKIIENTQTGTQLSNEEVFTHIDVSVTVFLQWDIICCYNGIFTK